MKKYIIFLLSFICLPSTIYSQIIKGTVLEKNTKSAIQHALVYFNGTSVGTYTDQKGFFEFDISKYNSMPLTISALGYYSVTLNEFPTDKPFLIYLPLKVFKLNEVNISAKHNAQSRE
ncbi:MAG: carboxypeptidase-like regulatory domain-containing protein, partial [Bacteroidales bacterium]|nr:carboxypeptidase-like regulatory domain-containing protein [Bacteroidales bacterium]